MNLCSGKTVSMLEIAAIVKKKSYKTRSLDLHGLTLEEANKAIEDFINRLSDQQQHEVTNIIMDNEKHVLHNWEKNNIYPKSKINAISQLTIETILNLRCNLIDKKVSEFKNENLDKSNVLEQVVNYMKLKRLLSEKLNRVL